MKNIIITLVFLFSVSIHSQDMSNVHRVFEEITLNDGLVEEYAGFESFWGTVKEKQIKDGNLLGWFVWKVDPKSNDNQPWTDYIVLNVFANKSQMDKMNSKDAEWWNKYIKSAHKGKTKRSVIKKYLKETTDNKYRKKSVTYTVKGLGVILTEQAAPQEGTKAVYRGIEQLNYDYVDFELNYFKPWHEATSSRLYWEVNEILSRSDNAYKPVTHTIFEIVNPDVSSNNENLSFTDQMMIKYGVASRKEHGRLDLELMNWRWN